MAEIKNPMAYFSAVIRNWNKTDYRSNDNFYKHISSVGDEHDIQDKGSFIVTKTGTHPMQTKLELFFKCGITFDAPYEIADKSARDGAAGSD